MFLDKVPENVIKNMLNYARNESALQYSLAMQQAGKEPTSEDLQFIDRCVDIAELFSINLMKQIDIYEAAIKKANPSD